MTIIMAFIHAVAEEQSPYLYGIAMICDTIILVMVLS